MMQELEELGRSSKRALLTLQGHGSRSNSIRDHCIKVVELSQRQSGQNRFRAVRNKEPEELKEEVEEEVLLQQLQEERMENKKQKRLPERIEQKTHINCKKGQELDGETRKDRANIMQKI